MALSLLDARAKAAAALAGTGDSDPAILGVEDALSPPCVVVSWTDPWLERMGQCLYSASLELRAVAARAPTPDSGVSELEEVVSYALVHLEADAEPWPVEVVTAPRAFEAGGVPLLDARITVRITVTTT